MTSLTRISNAHVSVEISPLGAEMQSLTTSDNKSWLWNGDAAWWSGRSPILFPIVGKAPDNKLKIGGKPYEMAQHGFARRSVFALTSSDTLRCRYELRASGATRAVYPFEFLLAVTHALDGRKLIITSEVENQNSQPMPFGLGYHPAFVWPLPGGGGKPHTVTLENGAEPTSVQLVDGLISRDRRASPFASGRLHLDPDLFKDDALIFPEGAGNALAYGADGGPSLKFRFENLPNLALWQKPGAPFICIEPWHGMAAEFGGSDDLAKRPYTVTLQPGETQAFTMTVELPEA